MKKIAVFIFFFTVGLAVNAQNTRNVEKATPSQPLYQSHKKEKKSLFLNKKKTNTNEIREFRARLKKVYKQKAKEEKLAKKPRYSNPAYFGHKHLPKKRPPGEQKFCKTCGIKH